MKKLFLFGALATIALGFVACTKDNTNDPKVVSITFSNPVYADNTVTLTANAENANTYTWDFDNGTTASGATATGTYKFPGEYWVKCTAAGKTNQVTDSIQINMENGDPTIVNEVTKLLASHPWGWAGNGTLPNDFGLWSAGPKGHTYTNDSAKYDYADPFDDSWWKLGEYDGVVNEGSLDDVYTFTLDKTMAYTNEYGETGFMFNWAWATKYGYGTPDVWADDLYMQGATKGSWDITIIEHDADTIPKTIVNGNEVAKSYIITLKGGAWLGVGAASPEYQICRIDSDTLWVRYDNTYPQDLPIQDAWADEGIALDDPEWDYFYLVKR